MREAGGKAAGRARASSVAVGASLRCSEPGCGRVLQPGSAAWMRQDDPERIVCGPCRRASDLTGWVAARAELLGLLEDEIGLVVVPIGERAEDRQGRDLSAKEMSRRGAAVLRAAGVADGKREFVGMTGKRGTERKE